MVAPSGFLETRDSTKKGLGVQGFKRRFESQRADTLKAQSLGLPGLWSAVFSYRGLLGPLDGCLGMS